ncbi:hypothetical protein [Pendulispora albinea]|uniref:Secreted protein n=1 Tax=Pendulispora albinea TaxID=2741071 RepID=A0ABZ2LWV3_9BACT
MNPRDANCARLVLVFATALTGCGAASVHSAKPPQVSSGHGVASTILRAEHEQIHDVESE